MLMPGRPNVKSRFTTTSVPIPELHGLIPRRYWWTTVAPMSPNTAPEAPTVRVVGAISSTPNDPAASEPV